MTKNRDFWSSGWVLAIALIGFIVSTLLAAILIGVAVEKARSEFKMPAIKVEIVEQKLVPPTVDLGEATDGGKVE